MKKKLLFVIYSLGGGGAEKALVNLLNLIDRSRYDISVQLFENRGINLEFLPEDVNLLPDLKSQQWMMESIKPFAKKALKAGKPGLLIKRLAAAARPRLKGYASSRYKTLCTWKAVRCDFPKPKEHYDIAIAYLQGTPIYYVVDCVQADRKIGWMHIDYSKVDDVPRQELLEYYSKLDAFISMSQKCVEELQDAFPTIRDKISLLHNLNAVNLIEELSERDVVEDMRSDVPTILSIGRLCDQKGYDYAIDAAARLVKEGVSFCWYVLGAGELEQRLKQQVADNGLEDRFIFLGLRTNPYPYIKKAAVIAQTSRYEGKSVVLDEAKILKKPILVTNYNSVGDQIQHEKTGYIVDMNAQDIARGLKEMLENPALCQQLVEGLEDARQEQQYWLEKHYEVFEGK